MKTSLTIAHSWNVIAHRSGHVMFVFIGTWSQGCLLDSNVFIKLGLITLISLVSTIQWEWRKMENTHGHSHQNEFTLM